MQNHLQAEDEYCSSLWYCTFRRGPGRGMVERFIEIEIVSHVVIDVTTYDSMVPGT